MLQSLTKMYNKCKSEGFSIELILKYWKFEPIIGYIYIFVTMLSHQEWDVTNKKNMFILLSY